MKKIVAIAVVLLIVPAGISAQQIKISTSNPKVGEPVVIELDRSLEHNASITWRIESGQGRFLEDVTQARVTFQADVPGVVVVVGIINAPGEQRRPSISLTIVGPVPSPVRPAQRATAKPPQTEAAPQPRPAQPANTDGTLALEDIDLVVPAGWMGDAMAENNATALLDPGHTDGCRSRQSCYRVEYKPGKVGWAAFAWQRVPEGSMNWGEYPGEDLSESGRLARGRRFQSLRLWAKADLSASGGTAPKAQFKSGGNVAPNFAKTNPASYTVAGPTVEIKDWMEYCLDLRGKDLKNTVSPLTVVLTRASNPKNATIVIDDVAFSTVPCKP